MDIKHQQAPLGERVRDHLKNFYLLDDKRATALLEVTASSIRKTLRQLEEVVSAGSVEQGAVAAHSLKGILLNLGAKQEAEMVRAIELRCREQGRLPTEEQLHQLANVLADLLG